MYTKVFTLPEKEDYILDFEIISKQSPQYNFCFAYKKGNPHVVFTDDDDFKEYLKNYDELKDETTYATDYFKKINQEDWSTIGNTNFLEHISL